MAGPPTAPFLSSLLESSSPASIFPQEDILSWCLTPGQRTKVLIYVSFPLSIGALVAVAGLASLESVGFGPKFVAFCCGAAGGRAVGRRGDGGRGFECYGAGRGGGRPTDGARRPPGELRRGGDRPPRPAGDLPGGAAQPGVPEGGLGGLGVGDEAPEQLPASVGIGLG